MRTTMPRHRSMATRVIALASAALLFTGLASPVVAHIGRHPYLTGQNPMLTPVAARTRVSPIITVGEVIGGYRFESIPDGLAVRRGPGGSVEVYVNHETSRVAFPYVVAGPNPSNSLNDFDNAQLSRLRLSPDSGGVIDASLVITSAERFHRFCSSFLGTREQGFSRDILFTNEEATDFVFRQGQGPEWTQPIPAGTPLAEQTGVVIAYDVASGARKPIYGMGRLNHENSVAIPGRGEIMLLTGDDTFTTNPPSPRSIRTSRRPPTRCGTTRGRSGASGPRTGIPTTTTTTSSRAPGPTSRGSSSRSRPTPRRAIRPRSSPRPTRPASSNSCGSRTSPTTAAIRMSSTSPTRDAPTQRTEPASATTVPAIGSRLWRPSRHATGASGRWSSTQQSSARHEPVDPHRGRQHPVGQPGRGGIARRDPSAGQPKSTKDSLLITEDPSSANQYPIATGTPRASGGTTCPARRRARWRSRSRSTSRPIRV